MDSRTYQTQTTMQSTAHAPSGLASGWSAQLDYLTAYWHPEDAEAFPENEILGYIHEQIEAGNDEQRRSSNGIEWFGAGGAAAGWRGGDRFIRYSGEAAARYGLAHSASSTSYSRADCALTQSLRSPRRGEAARIFRHLGRLPRAAGQPRKRTFTESEEGGQTVTLGSRTSDVYLRVYDYGIAHDCAPVGCRWRYEAELKGDRADWAVALLRSGEVRELAMAALVRTIFTDRRIDLEDMTGGAAIKLDPLTKTSRMKRLEWLQKQVRPAVERLIRDGQLEAAITALGLDPYVTINPKK